MILTFDGKTPQLHSSVFVAPSADVIGNVTIGKESSVWFQVVIRGDIHWIRIGERSNIQDHSCLHVTREKAPLTVGNDVTVGHRVTLHGCTIGNHVLVGMGSIIMDRAIIPDGCVVGAGSLVTEGKTFEPGTLIMGSPARAVRMLKPEEISYLKIHAGNYVKDAARTREALRSQA